MAVDAEKYLVQLRRWVQAKTMRRQRYTLEQIAKVLGVTRQRIHVLLQHRSPPYPPGLGMRTNPKQCRRGGCNRIVAVRGLCPTHYLEIHSADRNAVRDLMEGNHV